MKPKQEIDYVAVLKEYMRLNNLNQNDLGRQMGVSGVSVGRWLARENGITRTHISKIEHLCGPIIARMEKAALATGHGSAASVNGNATAAPVTINNGPDNSVLGDIEQDILENSKMCDACKVAALGIIKKHRKK